MCLSIAFSGRPTLMPTVAVVCLPTVIPEICLTMSMEPSNSMFGGSTSPTLSSLVRTRASSPVIRASSLPRVYGTRSECKIFSVWGDVISTMTSPPSRRIFERSSSKSSTTRLS